MAVEQPNLKKAKVGDKTIDTKNFNRLVEGVNKLNKISMDGSSVDYHTEDGILSSTLPRNTIIPKDPFHLGISNATTLAIYKGDWIRNQTKVTLSDNGMGEIDDNNEDRILISIDDFEKDGTRTKEEDVDYYVTVQLETNVASTYNYDPAIFPGDLIVFVDSDTAIAEAQTIEEVTQAIEVENSLPNNPFYLIKQTTVVGTVQLKQDANNDFYIYSIKQKVDEDIIDSQWLPDSNTEEKNASSYARASISFNEILDTSTSATQRKHIGELQIHNIANCAGQDSWSMPTFKSTNTNNTLVGPAGQVYWSAVDGEYYPLGSGSEDSKYKTLSINIDQRGENYPSYRPDDSRGWDSGGNSFTMLNLHNVLDTFYNNDYSGGAKSMCYYESSDRDVDAEQTEGELKWAAVDSTVTWDGGYQPQKSLEFVDGAQEGFDKDYKEFQLHNFNCAVSETLSDDSLLLFREAPDSGDGAVLKYADKDDVGAWVNVASNVSGQIDEWWDDYAGHYVLPDIIPGDYVKRDHGNHWCNPLTEVGRWASNNGDNSVNYGYSIGDPDQVKVIDLENRRLHAPTPTQTKDWYVDGGVRTFVISNSNDNTEEPYSEGVLLSYGLVECWKSIVVNKSNTGKYSGLFREQNNRTYAQTQSSGEKYVVLVDVDNNVASTHVNGSFVTQLARGNDAGYFTDGTIQTIVSDGSYGLTTNANINTSESYYVDGTQVVTSQQAAITDADGVSGTATNGGYGFSTATQFNNAITDINSIRTAVNNVIAALETHGLISN